MQPKKILVVEDEVKNHKVVRNLFKDSNYEIIHASNGEAGIEIAKLELPDVILMDWAMPIMNGLDAVLKLKAIQETKEIPVLMATGVMTSPNDLRDALEAGAIDYIRKPFDELEIKARVDSAIRLVEYHREILKKNEEILEKSKKIRGLLEKELESKVRESSILAMEAHEKDVMLSNTKKELERINKVTQNAELKALMKKLTRTLKNGQSWENFITHYEKVHPNFFASINAAYPRLTTNDLRLSAYIRIGIRNKEIAGILGIDHNSVRNSIRRLKKKLKIGPEDSIRDFLINY